ncbi:MAG: hypothetical protein KBG80_11425, partial [Breznakibacter sp.]|nr:hypothetical protein [Breznakibacter sp.]
YNTKALEALNLINSLTRSISPLTKRAKQLKYLLAFKINKILDVGLVNISKVAKRKRDSLQGKRPMSLS